MRLIFPILTVVLLVSSAAKAEEAIALSGAGIRTCGEFASEYRKTPEVAEAIFFTWAEAYMSGLNMASLDAGKGGRDLRSQGIKEQRMYLRVYCDAHPLSTYVAGVYELYRSLDFIKQPKPKD